MLRFRLCIAIVLLAAAPASGEGGPRIADIRVGQHGNYERIVVELESQGAVAVRWRSDPDGADVFEIDARPLLNRQVLASGRPRVGDLILSAAASGAELRLEPQARRTRAFQLDTPPRLVIDVAAPGDEPFIAPAEVHALLRDAPVEVAATPVLEPAQPAEPEAVPEAPPAEPQAAAPAEPAAPVEPAVAATEPPREEATRLASAEPVPAAVAVPVARERKSWFRSRALLVPLLAGAGVLVLAAGGLALASAQRSRPNRAAESHASVSDPAELTSTRLDLLEKRVDDEVRARSQLEGQLAQARAEIGSLRDVLARLRSQAAARAAAPSAPQ